MANSYVTYSHCSFSSVVLTQEEVDTIAAIKKGKGSGIAEKILTPVNGDKTIAKNTTDLVAI